VPCGVRWSRSPGGRPRIRVKIIGRERGSPDRAGVRRATRRHPRRSSTPRSAPAFCRAHRSLRGKHGRCGPTAGAALLRPIDGGASFWWLPRAGHPIHLPGHGPVGDAELDRAAREVAFDGPTDRATRCQRRVRTDPLATGQRVSLSASSTHVDDRPFGQSLRGQREDLPLAACHLTGCRARPALGCGRPRGLRRAGGCG
jgi:hypothetical protein